MENILHQEFESLEEDVGDGDNCIEESNLDDTDNQQKYQWYVGPKYSWYPQQKDIDDCLEALSSEDEYGHTDPYDKFMRRHLQHYGYYTGRNASFRDNFQSLQEWRRNYDVRLSGHHDLSLMEEQLGKPGNPLHNRLLEGPWEGQLPDDLLHRTTQLVFQYQAGRKIPKLREPRNLYALTKEAGPQQATRWPSHMQVVCPAIRFLDVTPANPEPLYKPTGKEPTPSVRGPQIGEMIYYNDPGRDLYFMRSRVAGCRLAMRSMTLTPRDYPEDNLTLEFESRFESGNLLKVDKITDFEYELTLRTDLYTNKHTQWYFFRVRNMRPGKTYRFTVVNLMKPSSLYNQGMRPLFYSDSNAKKNKIGWVRFGTNIRYYRNNLCSRDGRCFYSLTWQCDFPYKDDTCYFAHCYPYTYTDLQEYLLMLANDPVRSRFCKQRVLCRTLAGNLVYILTITSPSRNPEISRAKKAVVLSARVHPGETNASWMMKGFLDYLTGKSADAKLLRDTFIFKIVPMLNPDGVIVGNYRCSLAGRDLNRNYKSVLKDSFPSIWHTKMMVKKLRAEREVVLYCDLHGHSRKNNIFIYGCENKHNPQKRLRERVFPLMLSKNAHQSFSFDSCKYKVQKSKEGTGRIVMWYLGIMNSYTLEATFGGTSLPGTRKDTHLNTHDLEQIGFHFCDTLLDYCDPDLSKVEACMHELQERMRRQIMKKLRLQGSEDINIDDYMSDMESDTSGSDSSCDDGLPVHLLAIAPKLQRKKKMRTRRERNKANPSKTVVPQATESTKPTSHSAKTASDKIKAIRYSQGSNKKRDDRMTPSRPSAHSASSYTDDRGTSNDRSAKKLATVSLKYVNPLLGIFIARSGFVGKRSDYLEVLTSAYIRSGVLMVPDANKDYPLRYSNGSKPTPDGNFSVQYLANQLGMMTESEESKPNSPGMRNASCQWSPQPDSTNETDSVDQEEVEKEAILAEEQYEILRQSALKRQLSAGQQRLLAQKHLVAVAEMQQRKENKQRITSAVANRVSSGSPIKQHPNPFEEKKDDLGSDHAIMASDSTKPISRTASASNPIAHKPRSSRREGSSSASVANKEDPFTPRDIRSTANDDTEFFTTHRSRRPTSSNSEATAKKLSSFALPSQTSITVDTSQPLKEGFEETKKQTILSYKSRSHYFTNKDSLSDGIKSPKSETILDLPHKEQVEEKLAKSELIIGEESQSKPRVLTWISNDRAEHVPGNKLTAIKPFHSNKTHYDENTSLKEELVRKRQSLLNNPSSLAKSHSTELAHDLTEGRSPRRSTEQPSADLTITLPKRGTSLNQSEMKALVQGELALPRTTDTTVIPAGVKKSNAVVMETDPDKLTIKSNRYYVKTKPADSIAEVHSNSYRAKSYQTTDDSFFGMSDRIGLAMVPKTGTRVPPVVANIAELRRSLMGHGREGETTNPAGRKGSEEPQNQHEDGIPFSQRPRRRNPAARQRSRLEHEEAYPRHASHNKQITKPDVHETLKQDTQRRLATVFDDDEVLTDSDNMDTMSTTATFSDKHRSKRHREGIRKTSQRNSEKNAPASSKDDVISNDVTKPDSASRIYTQGNTTIEKSPENSMTNIRIGSKTNERDSQLLEHWPEPQTKSDNITTVPQSSTTPTISSVSLNISGENDDRTCVTTPALASRPVPPLLRYLSAKQVQSKKK